MAGIGTFITASDYNAIQAKAALVLGSGSGDYGYGQIVSSSAVAPTAKVTVAQWNSLRNDLVKCRQHQNSVTINNASLGEVGYVAGASLKIPTTATKIIEEDRVEYMAMADAVIANRLAVPTSADASNDFLVATQVRTTPWNGVVNQTITINFTDGNAARYFFNTGGRFEFSSSRTDGNAGSKNTTWTTLLQNMGTIYFDRFNTTAQAPGSGTNSSIGWEDLIASDQQVFEKDVTGTTYAPNRYLILAKVPVASQVVFTIQWRDDSIDSPPTNPPWYIDEDVDGTLTSIVKIYRATGTNVSVPFPSSNTTGIG